MGNKCPPHTLCINKTFITAITISTIVVSLLYHYFARSKMYTSKTDMHTNEVNPTQLHVPVQDKINYNVFTYTHPSDTFHSVYKPPIQENPYVEDISSRLNVNIPTSFRPPEYRQVGILTRIDPKDQERERETILALFGRPTHKSGSKWQYYTMTDKSQHIKLPIVSKNKTCTTSYGCDELFTDDTVFVQGYNDPFKITMYDVETMYYY